MWCTFAIGQVALGGTIPVMKVKRIIGSLESIKQAAEMLWKTKEWWQGIVEVVELFAIL